MGTRPVGHGARMRPGALHVPLSLGGQLGHDLGTAAAVATEGSTCQPPHPRALHRPPLQLRFSGGCGDLDAPLTSPPPTLCNVVLSLQSPHPHPLLWAFLGWDAGAGRSPPRPLKLEVGYSGVTPWTHEARRHGKDSCEPPRQGQWWAPSGRRSQAPPTCSTAASGAPLPHVCLDGQATGRQVGTRQGPGVGWVLPRGPRPVGLRREVSLTRRAGKEPGSLGVKAPGDRRMQAGTARVRAAGAVGLSLGGSSAPLAALHR